MKIPLVDLAWQHREIEAELSSALAAVMESGAFILGPAVAEFEEAFAAACGVAHCVGVGNGTDALELVLRAVEIGAGDEVVLPANTFVATALAVARAGARPVLVDCDPDHLLIDAEAAAAAVGPRTRAIIGVDLFGQVAPFEALEAVAEAAGLVLVEDAAQAQGATQVRGANRQGRSAGSFGVAAGTSFYPAKNLGAYGDAGAVTTNDPELAARVRRLRNYGSEEKYDHPERGFNSRLDSLQAAVLSVKLRRLADWNRRRRDAARRYDALLGGVEGVRLPVTAPGNEHVWHLYSVRLSQRDRVLAALHAEGIGAGVHYPIPIHLQGAFADLGYGSGAFPEAEKSASEMISLPLHPGISEAQQERVVEVLRAALGR